MAIIFWKNLLKCVPTAPQPSSPPTTTTTMRYTTKRLTTILSNNPSFHHEFSSSSSTTKSLTNAFDDMDSVPDFSAIFSSQRLFFTCPGRSNSIVDTPREVQQYPGPTATVIGGSSATAIKKYSPDPYQDFKNSMLEMIKARELTSATKIVDWDYLQELLCCYLSLNTKNTHHFIITAFVDIIIICLGSSRLSSSLSSSSPLESSIHGERRPQRMSAARLLMF